ncbi:fibrillin-1-like isoform X1 [Sycon ciliatum]|uniref:fibrillin-1-like isoform X1 n=2 Tax=Sycon ciliatum TaxID=27933 RepID=UPI0031F629A5
MVSSTMYNAPGLPGGASGSRNRGALLAKWLLASVLLSVMVQISCVSAAWRKDNAQGCLHKEGGVVIEANEINACPGTWTGHVLLGTCSVCAVGWRVCSWRDNLLGTSLETSNMFRGCYAMDASNDNETCGPCVDNVINRRHLEQPISRTMAGFGADCPYQAKQERSCFGSDRIDASRPSAEHEACHFQAGAMTGALCCRDSENEWRTVHPDKTQQTSRNPATPGQHEHFHSSHRTADDLPLPTCPHGNRVAGTMTWTCTVSVEIQQLRNPSNTVVTHLQALEKKYTRSTEQTICIDDNECLSQAAECHSSAVCTNTRGSYECRCKQGFYGDGITCHDVDECSEESHNCGRNTVCRNRQGSYSCLCHGNSIPEHEDCPVLPQVCTSGLACFNKGGCNSTSNTCVCRKGFTGTRCENSSCSSPCANGGRCVGKDYCKCRPGWRGRFCTNAICPQNCNNRGECIRPNLCRCRKRYIGDACEVRVYPRTL